jgi:hypothetical protein
MTQIFRLKKKGYIPSDTNRNCSSLKELFGDWGLAVWAKLAPICSLRFHKD